MNKIEEELKKLQQDIYADYGEERVWFYESSDNHPNLEIRETGVNGFLGTQNIFLLGLNPSTGKFPSKRDIKLYQLLKDKNLENIHITDLIKIRAKNEEVKEKLKDEKLVDKQILFLSKELKIIQPKIIFTMGVDCHNLFLKKFPDYKEKVIRVIHYCANWRIYADPERVFQKISQSLDEGL